MKYSCRALSSGLLLYGCVDDYGATGTLVLPERSEIVGGLAASPATQSLVLGRGVVVAGMAFKIGVVPFNMWNPRRVSRWRPRRLTLVIGSGPKLAPSSWRSALLFNGLPDLADAGSRCWRARALVDGARQHTAIAQTSSSGCRLSAIANMGFMLLGLLSGMVGGNWLNRNDAYTAALFYIIIYTVMSVGAFGMLLLLSRSGFDCENLDDMRGLNRRSPWYAFMMMLLMLSLAGLPPTAGFYAKLAVLGAAVAAGYIWLAVAAVVLSLVGAYYYLRIVKLLYFDDPRDRAPVATGRPVGVLLSANGLALLLFGILPQPVMNLCFVAVSSL